MPIQVTEDSGGKFLVIHVRGRLVKADYDRFVPEFERLVRQHGNVRLLFDMTGLHGWDAAAMWEDIKVGVKHYADIERCAMVGDRQWQHVMTVLCEPFTKAKIQYFDHADAARARNWLVEA